ncbi:uncharacterized protein METZ01_LOCUS24991 [marine metagenome]|jgi:hypothetical protein|uniref:Uncharacterized protein n=1 Tax=marine metagenome TaxID=408172 RepID=A0A381Q1U2_9ZZZZ|tara:strand:- start:2959 stop:3087 length:129 start_codon:yes stop_codon:yes gene_type:complete
MLHYQQILKFCLAEIIHGKTRFGFWFFVNDSADPEKYVLYIL